eukprot:TRINITY_DN111079_c0_g1_i1.p1 TRINITY_DN111079_c0_g1~~TRINITY_DN111079_c0_g1_i1.p1  ORF type:complete len:368 (+),score=85.97 TRINITY_DN111079_c0_g1_i1:70-1173(+)
MGQSALQVQACQSWHRQLSPQAPPQESDYAATEGDAVVSRPTQLEKGFNDANTSAGENENCDVILNSQLEVVKDAPVDTAISMQDEVLVASRKSERNAKGAFVVAATKLISLQHRTSAKAFEALEAQREEGLRKASKQIAEQEAAEAEAEKKEQNTRRSSKPRCAPPSAEAPPMESEPQPRGGSKQRASRSFRDGSKERASSVQSRRGSKQSTAQQEESPLKRAERRLSTGQRSSVSSEPQLPGGPDAAAGDAPPASSVQRTSRANSEPMVQQRGARTSGSDKLGSEMSPASGDLVSYDSDSAPRLRSNSVPDAAEIERRKKSKESADERRRVREVMKKANDSDKKMKTLQKARGASAGRAPTARRN